MERGSPQHRKIEAETAIKLAAELREMGEASPGQARQDLKDVLKDFKQRDVRPHMTQEQDKHFWELPNKTQVIVKQGRPFPSQTRIF